jgi:hypothetical protein
MSPVTKGDCASEGETWLDCVARQLKIMNTNTCLRFLLNLLNWLFHVRVIGVLLQKGTVLQKGRPGSIASRVNQIMNTNTCLRFLLNLLDWLFHVRVIGVLLQKRGLCFRRGDTRFDCAARQPNNEHRNSPALPFEPV